MRHRFSIWPVFLVVLSAPVFAQPPTPVVIDLETLGNTYSEAYAVNNRGQVVGRSGGQAFLWTLQDGMMRLGELDPWGSSANIINDRGEMAGTSRIRGFYWSKRTGVIDIGTLGGDGATPADMNNVGQMVGESLFEPGSWTARAFFWSLDTGMVDLGTLPGGRFSGAYRINDAGQVLGWSETRKGKVLPVLWTRAAGMQRFLPPLPMQPVISGLSEHGEVAGIVSGHGFYWSAVDGLVDIGTLGGPSSWATAINDHSQIAGFSLTAAPDQYHAFIWTHGEGMADVGGRGRFLTVNDLSNNGEIVGRSAFADPGLADTAYVGTVHYGILPLLPIAGRQSSASAINDRGHLVGFSTVAAGSVDQHAVLWLIRRPVEQLDAMLADVEALVAGGTVQPVFGHGLASTLQGARVHVVAGRTPTGCSTVRVFISQIDLLDNKGWLAADAAGLLRDQAEWTLFGLGCRN